MKHNLFIHTFCLLVIGFLGSANLWAQPQIEWQKSLGGSSNDQAVSTQQTTDGGYIIAGNSGSNDGDITVNHGFLDVWVVKLDATGVMQWQKSFGGSDSDAAASIQQTTDGGYIVAGYSSSTDGDVVGNHGSGDFWVLKLDATGTMQWQKSLGGSGSDAAASIRQTADGGYIVAGYSGSTDGDVSVNYGISDYWVVKLDVTGAIQWQKSFGGSGNDIANAIQQTSDGGYIATGSSTSNNGDVSGNHGAEDYWTIKLDATGTMVWQKSLGGSSFDIPSSIQQSIDGGYIIAGYSYSNDGDITGNHGLTDCWIVKTDSIGTIEWQKALGGTYMDGIAVAQQTSDGSYIVAGGGTTNGEDTGDITGGHGNSDYWIIKLTTIGTIEWQQSFGGTLFDGAYAIQQTTDDGYIVAGYSKSSDGDVTLNHGNDHADDFWIAKLSSYNTATETTISQNITISPNPTTGEVHINIENLPNTDALQVSITNLLGQTILQQEMTTPTCTLDIPTQPAGVYFLHIKQANGIEIVRKVEKL